MPKIIVKYLLWLRDKASTDKDIFIFPQEVTLEDLVNEITIRRPALKKYLARIFDKNNDMIILVNGKPGKPDLVLRDNDVVSIMPPVSGG